MKLINPILITLNNTLHIKADNLEAVEVDSSCDSELMNNACSKWINDKETTCTFDNYLNKGINISELSDRIEVRDKRLYRDDNGTFIGCKLFAFLLPEKETKCDGTCAENECICEDLQECLEIVDKKSYTIEEIERAFAPINEIIGDGVMKQLFKNLKK